VSNHDVSSRTRGGIQFVHVGRVFPLPSEPPILVEKGWFCEIHTPGPDLSLLDQAGRMVSDSLSQSITLFCRRDSTPILMATIVEAPRSTLQANSSPFRMASRKLPL
jgi:hypothetical protein